MKTPDKDYVTQHLPSFTVYYQDQKCRLASKYPFLPPDQITSRIRDQWRKMKTNERRSFSLPRLCPTPQRKSDTKFKQPRSDGRKKIETKKTSESKKKLKQLQTEGRKILETKKSFKEPNSAVGKSGTKQKIKPLKTEERKKIENSKKFKQPISEERKLDTYKMFKQPTSEERKLEMKQKFKQPTSEESKKPATKQKVKQPMSKESKKPETKLFTEIGVDKKIDLTTLPVRTSNVYKQISVADWLTRENYSKKKRTNSSGSLMAEVRKKMAMAAPDVLDRTPHLKAGILKNKDRSLSLEKEKQDGRTPGRVTFTSSSNLPERRKLSYNHDNMGEVEDSEVAMETEVYSDSDDDNLLHYRHDDEMCDGTQESVKLSQQIDRHDNTETEQIHDDNVCPEKSVIVKSVFGVQGETTRVLRPRKKPNYTTNTENSVSLLRAEDNGPDSGFSHRGKGGHQDKDSTDGVRDRKKKKTGKSKKRRRTLPGLFDDYEIEMRSDEEEDLIAQDRLIDEFYQLSQESGSHGDSGGISGEMEEKGRGGRKEEKVENNLGVSRKRDVVDDYRKSDGVNDYRNRNGDDFRKKDGVGDYRKRDDVDGYRKRNFINDFRKKDGDDFRKKDVVNDYRKSDDIDYRKSDDIVDYRKSDDIVDYRKKDVDDFRKRDDVTDYRKKDCDDDGDYRNRDGDGGYRNRNGDGGYRKSVVDNYRKRNGDNDEFRKKDGVDEKVHGRKERERVKDGDDYRKSDGVNVKVHGRKKGVGVKDGDDYRKRDGDNEKAEVFSNMNQYDEDTNDLNSIGGKRKLNLYHDNEDTNGLDAIGEKMNQDSEEIGDLRIISGNKKQNKYNSAEENNSVDVIGGNSKRKRNDSSGKSLKSKERIEDCKSNGITVKGGGKQQNSDSELNRECSTRIADLKSKDQEVIEARKKQNGHLNNTENLLVAHGGKRKGDNRSHGEKRKGDNRSHDNEEKTLTDRLIDSEKTYSTRRSLRERTGGKGLEKGGNSLPVEENKNKRKPKVTEFTENKQLCNKNRNVSMETDNDGENVDEMGLTPTCDHTDEDGYTDEKGKENMGEKVKGQSRNKRSRKVKGETESRENMKVESKSRRKLRDENMKEKKERRVTRSEYKNGPLTTSSNLTNIHGNSNHNNNNSHSTINTEGDETASLDVPDYLSLFQPLHVKPESFSTSYDEADDDDDDDDDDDTLVAPNTTTENTTLEKILQKLKQIGSQSSQDLPVDEDSPKLLSPTLSGVSTLSSLSEIDNKPVQKPVTMETEKVVDKLETDISKQEKSKKKKSKISDMFQEISPQTKKPDINKRRRLAASNKTGSDSNFNLLFQETNIFL